MRAFPEELNPFVARSAWPAAYGATPRRRLDEMKQSPRQAIAVVWTEALDEKRCFLIGHGMLDLQEQRLVTCNAVNRGAAVR